MSMATAFVDLAYAKALNLSGETKNQFDIYAKKVEDSLAGNDTLQNTFKRPTFTPPKKPDLKLPEGPLDALGNFNDAQKKFHDQLVGDLTDFLNEYFPNNPTLTEKALERLMDMLDGKTGIPTEIEDQIWQRDRARVLNEVDRAVDEALSTFAARRFPMPPGAATHAVYLAQVEAQDKIAQHSRDVAIKQAEIVLENIKWAVEQAINLRFKAISAALDYIKTLAQGAEIGVRFVEITQAAQIALIKASTELFTSQLRVDELVLDAQIKTATFDLEVAKTELTVKMNKIEARVKALTELARSLGTQTAAALNVLHASASVQAQGELDA